MPEKPSYEELERRIRELERAVDEARQRKESFQEIEQRDNALFERNLNPIAIIDKEWQYLDANPAFLQFVQKSKQELLSMHTFDFAPIEKKVFQRERHEAVWDTGGTVETEYLINGQVKVLELAVTPILHRGIRAVIGLGRDITEQKAAESALRFKSRIVEQSLDSIICTDDAFRITYMNKAAERLFGWRTEELIGKKPDMLNADSDSEEIQQDLYHTLSTGRTYEGVALNRKKDGSTFWCQFRVTPLKDNRGNIFAYMGSQRDISERMKRENEILESRSLLQQSQKIADIGSFVWDLRDDSLKWSDNMYAIHGLSRNTFTGNLSDVSRQLIHPDDRATVQSEIQKMIAAKKVWPMEFRITRADGEERVMRSDGEFELDDKGEPIKCIGVHQDITETRRTLMELEESKSVLRTVLDATPNCIFVKDREGRYLLVNSAIAQLYHSNPDEMIGKTDIELAQMGRVGHAEALAFIADDREVMETKKPKTIFTESVTSENGAISWFKTVKTSIFLPNNPDCLLGVATDITKLKEVELALEESEGRIRTKLEAILSPEGDIGMLDLADILDTEAVQKMMDHFYDLTNVGMAVVDLKGNILVATGWQDICTRFHRVHPETRKNCIESDLELSSGVEPGTFKIYRCKNNMWDMATPIVVGGKHLGNLFLGQFFFDDELPDYETFREQARRYGFDEAAYLNALDRVPRWSREMIDAVMNFYARFADFISSLSYSNLKLARALEQRERTEAALRKERERFKQILEGFPYGIYIVDQDYCVEYVNLFLRSQFGQPLDLKCYQYFHGLEAPCPWCKNQKVFQGETVHWHWRSSRTGKDYELVDIPLENDDGTVSKLEVFHDVTDRKRAEKALVESEQRFRTIIESAPINILAVRNGKFVFVNPAGIRLHGYDTLDEMIGLDALEGVAPEFRDKIRDRIMRNEIGYENPDVEFKILKPNGQEVWFKSKSVVINFEGKPTTLILGRDITREKLADEERARLMSAIEQAGEVIVITDAEGYIQYVNPAFEKITGYRGDEVTGKNPRILKSGRQDQSFYKDLWETIASGRTWKRRIVNRRKDGTLYTEEASISPVMDQQGVITNYVAVKRDVTVEIEMEKRLSQAQKMESIGNLAGGIAHDFNNILSPIMLHAEMIMMDLPAESPLQMNMKQIYTSGERARELVQQILTFARVKEKEKIPLKASLIVKEAVKFLRATLPTTIDLSYEINTDRDTVMADPTQMHQIVMNLCTNAAQAMQDRGGELKVKLIEVHVGPKEAVELGGIVPGDFVKISVSDTGSGIAPDIIEKIFEPYFTTKEQGQGTGLGLAVIHGIVQGCEGHIAVESEVGKGSVFHVYLPIVDAHVSTVQEEKSELPKGTEHILLVDDEQAAVTAIQPLLERLGYRITAKTDSLEALDLFRQAPEAFDIVITDQTMPHMTGKDLALELMAMRPDIPIILCTGFSEQINEDAAKRMGIRAFVPKPIVMHQMARAIREAVE